MSRFLPGLALVLGAIGWGAEAQAQETGGLLICDVTLIDGTGRAPVANAWVRVADGRIAEISRGPMAGVDKELCLDGSGKYLMPGLIDVHIHLRGGRGPNGPNREVSLEALAGYLYAGVTSVYDAGNMPDHIMGLRADERAGTIPAPRIFATGGIITYPGSHGGGPGATLVDDWPEGKVLLDEHIARNPDMAKFTLEERGWGARPMIPSLPVDLLETMIEYMNDHGVRTTVHTPSEIRARQAIFAGVDTLAHPVIVGPISESFAKLMGAKKIPMATTLTIGENYSRLVEHKEYLDQPLYRAVIAPRERATLQGEVRDAWEVRDWTWWMKIMTPIAQENLRQIHAAGGVLALGTDQSNGAATHRELELIVASGISPLDAIRIGTLGGAVFLGRGDELGSIQVGKRADMVLLSADPSLDINNAKLIEAVFKGGVAVDRDALQLAGER